MLEVGEPLWLEDDQEWALALLAEEYDACHGCGQPRSESQAVEANVHGRLVPAHTYEAERVECAGCRAKSAAAEDAKDHPHPSAISYRVNKLT